MPTDLWTPSDALLDRDPVAVAQVQHPHPRSALPDAVVLPDVVDSEELSAAAAAVLAELDDDDNVSNGEDGRRADDDDVDPDVDEEIDDTV